MRITAIRLHNVRQFVGAGVALEGLGAGVNRFVAANESGKSTTFDALHALFFQPHTSRAGPIEALKPYAGGSPLVEADIETPSGRYRLAKRFLGSRRSASVTDLATGRIVAQADEAEAFIAGLVRGGTTGPAGLLWVRQGLTGIERRARSEEEAERQARESVLASVQGEVEAITGGRRMLEVRAACEADLALYVTETGRPKTGGPYQAAIEDAEAARLEEARLAREVQGLHEALERRRRARSRLAELQRAEVVEDRRRALAAAEAGLAQARSRGEALRAAEAQAGEARLLRDQARAALAAFRDMLARHEAATRRRQTLRATRQAALDKKVGAAQASRDAAQAVAAAEQEEEAARTLLGRLDRALAARAAAERLGEAQAGLDRAEAARAEVEGFEARLRVETLPDGAVKAIEAAEREVLALRAAAEAASPRLAVAYEPGIAGAVSLDGSPLAEGEERPLGPDAAITVAGVGRLVVSGLPRDADARLESAEAKRRALFARLGVASLAEAHGRDEAARAAKAGLDQARRLLAAFAPNGLADLREALARLRAESEEAGSAPDSDPEAARAALEMARERVGEARLAQRAAEPARDEAADSLAGAEAALAGVEAEIGAIAGGLGPQAERADREAALAEAAAVREAAAEAVEARLAVLDRGAADVESAEAAQRRARSAIEAAEKEISASREEIARLDGEIGLRADEAVEEVWAEARDALAAAEARLARHEREVAVLLRLRAALEAARADAREHYFRPVMRELAPLMRLLFDDASVSFDDETLQPSRVVRRGQEERIDVLSGGTREQLAILTRLAFARLLAQDGRAAPVILDDALVYSDDDRIERMFDALHREARDQQIIVLSCRQRAFDRLGGTPLAFTPWSPAEG